MLTPEREAEIAETLIGYRIQEGREAVVALEISFIAMGAASLLADSPYEVPLDAKKLIENPQQVLPHQLASLVTFEELREFFDGLYWDYHMEEIHGTDWDWSDPAYGPGWSD